MSRIPVDSGTIVTDNGRPSSEGVPVSDYKKIGESMGLSGNLIVVPQPVRSQPQTPSTQEAKTAAPSAPEGTGNKDC